MKLKNNGKKNIFRVHKVKKERKRKIDVISTIKNRYLEEKQYLEIPNN